MKKLREHTNIRKNGAVLGETGVALLLLLFVPKDYQALTDLN